MGGGMAVLLICDRTARFISPVSAWGVCIDRTEKRLACRARARRFVRRSTVLEQRRGHGLCVADATAHADRSIDPPPSEPPPPL